MRINDLHNAEGAKREAKRLGRGTSSGLGKTSGKGQKGQKVPQRLSGSIFQPPMKGFFNESEKRNRHDLRQLQVSRPGAPRRLRFLPPSCADMQRPFRERPFLASCQA